MGGETLPRIAGLLDLARSMRVHVLERPTGVAKAWFEFLGIDVVWGIICAKQAFIPQDSGCRGGAEGAIMQNIARDRLASIPRRVDEPLRIMILWRRGSSVQREVIQHPYSLQRALRRFGEAFVEDLVNRSIPSQLRVFGSLGALVGSHGAGLANMMFMRRGAYLVEIASRQRPESPVYSNFGQRAYVLGLHYYHYYWWGNQDSYVLNVSAFVGEFASFIGASTTP